MKTKFIYLLLFLCTFLIYADEKYDFNSYDERYDSRVNSYPRIKYSFTYIAKRDTKSLLYNHVDGQKEVSIKANEEVTVKCDPISGKGVLLSYENYGFLAYKDDEQLIWNMKDFALDGKSWIPNNITDNKWVMKYHYDVLKSKDRDTLSKYEWWIDIFDEKLSDYFYVDNGGESASVKSWWQEYIGSPELIFTDCCAMIKGFFYLYSAEGYVEDVYSNKIKVKWYLAHFPDNFNDSFESIKSTKESIIEYYLDGDYLTIYIDGNKIELAKKCDDFDTQWESLIQDDYCSLDNIIWPHHADGTSEYEDTIRYSGEEVNNNSSNDSESNDEEFSQEFLDWLSGKEYETQEQSEDDSKEKNEEIYKINKIQILFFFIIIIIFSIIIIKIIIQKNKKKRQ